MNEERNPTHATPSDTPLRLAVVLSTTREGRFADTIATWLLAQLREDRRFEVDLIDPRHAGLSLGWGHVPAPLPEGVPSLSERLAHADAFLFVVPEYNHSFPATLKALIDSAKHEWSAKPAAFVSYGGISGGLRAVEQLRLVLAELHVVGMRDGVSFHRARTQFDELGKPRDAEGVQGALDTSLRQLAWWAQALRAAKRQHPYGS
jgi:NAD(P)H-dependent FMN reductase